MSEQSSERPASSSPENAARTENDQRNAEQPKKRPRRRRRGPRRPAPLQPDTRSSDATDSTGARGAIEQRPAGSRSSHGSVSVVLPLYNEEESLRELHQQLSTALGRSGSQYELLFVDDGSTDRSFEVLRTLKKSDHRHVRIIRFRRNYGKSAALAVGFAKATGEVIITMDADLQDDPAEIPGLIQKIRDGYDLVSGWKKVRYDPITKTLPSKFFNAVTSMMTGIRLHDFNCGLKAYRADVAKGIQLYGELHRYIPVLAHWQGFKIGEHVVRHRARRYGKSKFGIGRFWKGFLDLMTVLFTTRYFRRPLHLFGVWGVAAVLAGIVIDGWLVVEWFLGHTSLSNRPLFLGGILLIIVGIQVISIGLLGEMISKLKHPVEEYTIRDFIR